MTAAVKLLLPYQARAVESNARFTWHNWSRQTGKSHAGSLRRILRGIARRRNQLFLSAGERQSRELMEKARQHVRAMKIAFEFREDRLLEGTEFKQLEIVLPPKAGGIRVLGLPANPRTVRGFTGDVMLDEFAMHQNDWDIWASIFPSVTRGEGELDVWSTPKGRQNRFYDLAANALFEHDRVTIYDAIEQGLDVDPEILRHGMGDEELWRQEYLCEFVDEATAFLTYEMIGECEDGKLPRELDIERLAEKGGNPVFVGVDVGRIRDLTVIWAFERVGSTLISLGLIEIAGMPFRGQFEIISNALQSPRVSRCCIDATGMGMTLAEELAGWFGSYKVQPCTFTPKFNAEIAADLKVRFEDRRIRIPVCDRIRNDLHSVRKSVTSGGTIRLEAPREGGSHADRFYAAALACHAAKEDVGKIECETGTPWRTAGLKAFMGAWR